MELKVVTPAPLSWIAEYLSNQCNWHGGDGDCPIGSEFPFGCPFEPNEDGIIWCSEVKKEDWLRAIEIDIDERAEEVVNNAE